MNVLVYAPFPNGRFPGGITFIAEALKKNTEYFCKKGIELSFINSSPVYRVDSSQGKICPQNIKNFFVVKSAINKLICTEKYEILHFNSSVKLALLKDLLLIYSLKRKYAGRIILHIHYADISGILFNNKLLNRLIFFLMSHFIDQLILLSLKLKNQLKSFLTSELRTSILYNFHTLPKYDKVPEKNHLQLLFLGSMDERKGFHDLIEALSYLTGQNYLLKAAGRFLNNSFKDRMERKVRLVNMNVEFLGYVTGEMKIKLLKDSSILILPSYQEGLPVVILEAMASGCAIITSRAGAIGELLDDNNALFIRPGDIHDIASGIATLLSDESLRRKLQLNNLICSGRYNFHNFCEGLSDVYFDNYRIT